MALERCPRFEYETAQDTVSVILTATISQRPWDYDVPVHGSARWTATGIPVPDVSREDMDLDVRIRFDESDWPEIEAFILQVQDCQAFDFVPDVLEDSTAYEVYLVHPHVGEEILPVRMGDWTSGFDFTITLRKVDGTPWELEYLQDVPQS